MGGLVRPYSYAMMELTPYLYQKHANKKEWKKREAEIHRIVDEYEKSLNELSEEDRFLAGEMLLSVKKIAKSEKINLSGYRTVFNTNDDGGHTVFHIHMHLIGGRKMDWPPG